MKNLLNKLLSLPRYIKRAAVSFVVIFCFYVSCVYHIDTNEMGVCWNPFSGELKGDTISGFNVSPPWVLVSKIDLRPERISITSTANSYNSLLVSFDKNHWREFVQIQGFGYWWWNNRFSFNSGYDEEYRGMKDILRGYAYGNKKYKFIVVIEQNYSTQE